MKLTSLLGNPRFFKGPSEECTIWVLVSCMFSWWEPDLKRLRASLAQFNRRLPANFHTDVLNYGRDTHISRVFLESPFFLDELPAGILASNIKTNDYNLIMLSSRNFCQVTIIIFLQHLGMYWHGRHGLYLFRFFSLRCCELALAVRYSSICPQAMKSSLLSKCACIAFRFSGWSNDWCLFVSLA